MVFPNGNMATLLKHEEAKAAKLLQIEEKKPLPSIIRLEKGTEIKEVEIVARVDDLEIRLKKRTARYV